MILDVVALVLCLSVLLLFVLFARALACFRNVALAAGLRADGGQRDQLLDVGAAAGRAVGRLAELDELFEEVTTGMALVVIDRHTPEIIRPKIAGAQPRTNL